MRDLSLFDTIRRIVTDEIRSAKVGLIFLGSRNQHRVGDALATGELNGGAGGAGEIVGYLSQQRVVYDTTEYGWNASMSYLPYPGDGSDSGVRTLADNLSRIRQRIASLEGGTGGIGSPDTLTVSTINQSGNNKHTHAIVASSNPGLRSALLKTDSGGVLYIDVLMTTDYGVGYYKVSPHGYPALSGYLNGNTAANGVHQHSIDATYLYPHNSIVAADVNGSVWINRIVQGTPSKTTMVAGSLSGQYGYAPGSNAVGVGLGEYGVSSMVFDVATGIQVLGNTSNVISQWRTADNTIVIGEEAVGRNRVVIESGAIRFVSRSAQGDTNVMTLDSAGNIFSNYTAGISGLKMDYLGNAEFNNIKARGAISSAVFVYNQVQATAGTGIVAKAAAKLRSSVMLGGSLGAGTMLIPPVLHSAGSSVATNVITVEDPDGVSHATAGGLWAANDIVRLRDGANDCYLTVVSKTDMTTYWQLTCNVISGSGYFVVGTAVVNYGGNGAGVLLSSADDTNGPFFSVRTLTTTGGPPPTGYTLAELARLGNLNGNWGYASNTYGVAMGQYAVGQTNIAIDTTSGIRIRNYATAVGLWNPAGDFKIGTDVSAAAFTNLALLNAAQTYNGESLGAGDMLLGDNTSSKANMLWDRSNGKVRLRSGSTTHSYLAANGEFMAGDDSVRIDRYGLRGEVRAMATSKGELHAIGGSIVVLNASTLVGNTTIV